MSHDAFDSPSVHLNRIYTRAGDGGETRLAGGQRVAKDGLRIETYGTVDELNAFIGAARVTAEADAITTPDVGKLGVILRRIQHELFNLGSILATMPEDVHPRQARITAGDVTQLEHEMDEANAILPSLTSFVLPGGSRLDADLHICRTVCRRAERLLVALSRAEPIDEECVRYLNRLSDALFIWSRWANHVAGKPETLWQPNEAAGSAGAS